MNTKPKFLLVLLAAAVLLLLPSRNILASSQSSAQGQAAGHSPADLIKAVNDLRLANGEDALAAHPALMRVAQWEADAILAGAEGHTRPPGLTLGQWMISYGYPLGGNIAQDGYRSENWVGGREMTVDQAITSWLGDAPHTNTMLSSQRSDIGAGVAVGQDDEGRPVYIYVIETALQTSSGEQQYEAQLWLTAMPQTQAALYGDSTQAAAALTVPQFMIPVALVTARPDGDVVHQVQYGQTLWSIAIEYGLKIEDIKRLNNLVADEVYPNQQLLVQKAATQPVPTATVPPPAATALPSATPSPTGSATPTPQPGAVEVESSPLAISTLAMFLIVILLIPGGLVMLYLNQSRRADQGPKTEDGWPE